jgi:hypothetical protein
VIALGACGADTPRLSLLALHPHVEMVLIVNGAGPNTETTIRPIAHILQRQFGLPLPARVTAHVYDGRVPFEQGLVTYAALPAPSAAEMAQFASGATIAGTVLLRAPVVAAGPAVEWPRLIAHELTHLAQIELAGDDIGPAQWLAEGMADWVAYRVVDGLGLSDFAGRRAIARMGAAEYVRRARGLDLARLANPRTFIARHRDIGTLVTYRLTLHLTDELVSRHGFPALLSYFRAFRLSDDAEANFAAIFGISVDGFARVTRDRLRSDGVLADRIPSGSRSELMPALTQDQRQAVPGHERNLSRTKRPRRVTLCRVNDTLSASAVIAQGCSP